jgi:pimeloyl-ACP methyl ester carboxylesterase
MRITTRFAALSIFACSVLCNATAQAVPEFQFQFSEKPGPYTVGLKVVEQYDRSRQFQMDTDLPVVPAKGPRPLQTLMWYPAQTVSGQAMTLGDYGALIKTETTFGKPVEHSKPQSFVDAYMQGTAGLHTWAIRDGEMKSDHFPVVIYDPSMNAPATENIELCEYLASMGFVVIASPSMGATSRSMTIDISGANAEAADISFLLDFASTLPDTDMSKVAAMGYSWGGMAALFAAARHGRINALISLDGSFRYSPETVQSAGDIHPDRMTIPLLVFSRAEEPLETWDAMRKDKSQCACAPNVLNEWTDGDQLHVRFLGISHIQFSSLYQRSERFRKEGMRFVPADYSLEDGAVSYNWMARYTVEFLNAYLKQEKSAELFLKRTPTENGVPKHLMAVTLRQAPSKPNQGDIPAKK